MSDQRSGKIIKGIGGFYYVYAEDAGLYECRARGIFRSKKMKPMVGDQVEIDVISEDDKTGNIIAIHERANHLVRPMVANIDQALVIFSVHEPEPNFNLLNRFLIMMKYQEIPVIIGFNKADLAGEAECRRIASDYQNCGCRVLFYSAAKGQGLEEIRELLQEKTTVMAGPSGVGKSSTLNGITRTRQMETGSVSKKIKRGRHTTRHSELIYLAPGTYLMDTPGFSSLYIDMIDKDALKYCFPEFAPYENTCRYHGCAHIHEPDCKVKEALALGKISRSRYEDYCLLYRELKQIKKW